MTRITLEIDVDLDPMPGAFHHADDAARRIYGLLHMRIPHYNPEVRIKEARPTADLKTVEGVRHEALRMAIEMHPDESRTRHLMIARDYADFMMKGR